MKLLIISLIIMISSVVEASFSSSTNPSYIERMCNEATQPADGFDAYIKQRCQPCSVSLNEYRKQMLALQQCQDMQALNPLRGITCKDIDSTTSFRLSACIDASLKTNLEYGHD